MKNLVSDNAQQNSRDDQPAINSITDETRAGAMRHPQTNGSKETLMETNSTVREPFARRMQAAEGIY
jgi:hypothetical protein